MKTGLVFDPLFSQHDPGTGHPESPARYAALDAAFKDAGFRESLLRIPVREATDAEILLAHKEEYLRLVEGEIKAGVTNLSTGDTALCAKSLEVARMASGGVLEAVDAVMAGKCKNAFCATRPPGHHATADRGMGFCILNHVAIAARYMQKNHGIGRVAIIDWDVHHGNGTQDIFYEDGSVFYFSSHQSPLYPGTGDWVEKGAGAGMGTTMNTPFRAGADMVQIGGAFRELLLPALREFRPGFLLISAGFDSRHDDPLGGFELTDEDFGALTRMLMEFADETCGGRIVSVLEGGYNVRGMASAAVAHIRELCT